MINKKK